MASCAAVSDNYNVIYYIIIYNLIYACDVCSTLLPLSFRAVYRWWLAFAQVSCARQKEILSFRCWPAILRARTSVYTHAGTHRRTTSHHEMWSKLTAVMVRFDFLIIIRLLSLTSPFRFDNGWKRLSSSFYRLPPSSPPPTNYNSGDIFLL